MIFKFFLTLTICFFLHFVHLGITIWNKDFFFNLLTTWTSHQPFSPNVDNREQLTNSSPPPIRLFILILIYIRLNEKKNKNNNNNQKMERRFFFLKFYLRVLFSQHWHDFILCPVYIVCFRSWYWFSVFLSAIR